MPEPLTNEGIIERLRPLAAVGTHAGDPVHGELFRDAVDVISGPRARIAELERERDEARQECALAKAIPDLSSEAIGMARAHLNEHLEPLGAKVNCAFFDDCIHNAVAFALIANSERDALRSEVERLRPWATFGASAFEDFWHDAEPGDLDAGDLQDSAIKAGLLRRRTEADAGKTCGGECGCEWEEGRSVDECECLFPAFPPLTPEAPDAE